MLENLVGSEEVGGREEEGKGWDLKRREKRKNVNKEGVR